MMCLSTQVIIFPYRDIPAMYFKYIFSERSSGSCCLILDFKILYFEHFYFFNDHLKLFVISAANQGNIAPLRRTSDVTFVLIAHCV